MLPVISQWNAKNLQAVLSLTPSIELGGNQDEGDLETYDDEKYKGITRLRNIGMHE